jgi:23S rRNA pseudouridine1911/1915/1917 synthase
VKVSRLMLHAWKLAFEHPLTQKRMEFKAAIPEEFRPWLARTALE